MDDSIYERNVDMSNASLLYLPLLSRWYVSAVHHTVHCFLDWRLASVHAQP